MRTHALAHLRPSLTHKFHSRADVVAHLEDESAHGWVEPKESPASPHWRTMDGGYLLPTEALLALHRELHALTSER